MQHVLNLLYGYDVLLLLFSAHSALAQLRLCLIYLAAQILSNELETVVEVRVRTQLVVLLVALEVLGILARLPQRLDTYLQPVDKRVWSERVYDDFQGSLFDLTD